MAKLNVATFLADNAPAIGPQST